MTKLNRTLAAVVLLLGFSTLALHSQKQKTLTVSRMDVSLNCCDPTCPPECRPIIKK